MDGEPEGQGGVVGAHLDFEGTLAIEEHSELFYGVSGYQLVGMKTFSPYSE